METAIDTIKVLRITGSESVKEICQEIKDYIGECHWDELIWVAYDSTFHVPGIVGICTEHFVDDMVSDTVRCLIGHDVVILTYQGNLKQAMKVSEDYAHDLYSHGIMTIEDGVMTKAMEE